MSMGSIPQSKTRWTETNNGVTLLCIWRFPIIIASNTFFTFLHCNINIQCNCFNYFSKPIWDQQHTFSQLLNLLTLQHLCLLCVRSLNTCAFQLSKLMRSNRQTQKWEGSLNTRSRTYNTDPTSGTHIQC